MKNNDLKKYLIYLMITMTSFILIFLFNNRMTYNEYNKSLNNKVLAIVEVLKKDYPDITENEIIEILNSVDSNKDNNDMFNKYGIDLEEDSLIVENKNIFEKSNVLIIVVLIINGLVIGYIFIRYYKNQTRKINEITNYIEEINNHNYHLDIDSNEEGQLSILKNEIYKTTVMLNEIASNSIKAKTDLKISLSDISHQLKTPITSILIMLDNIIENPNMPEDIRQEFLHDIKKEINNINFLAQSLLTLSKLDSNTINFNKEKVKVSDLVQESIKRLESLCDLRNVKIVFDYSEDDYLSCDNKWQIEALTNIIRNGIEHSFEDSDLIVNVKQNNVYTLIEVINYGHGISKKDLPYIFDRFYQGTNATKDSVGIGLALSKSIVEKDNGRISVESNDSQTVFRIKYFK